MSGGGGGGAVQPRTTYLISLTLVKVEAVEDGGPAPSGRAEASGPPRTAAAVPTADGATVGTPGGEDPACRLPTPPVQRTRAEPFPSPPAVTAPPAEVTESARTPTAPGPPARPAGQRPASLLKCHGGAATRGRDSREGRERSPASAQSLDRKDCRAAPRSPGPCRASWAEAGGPQGWRDPRDEAGTPPELGGAAAAAVRDVPGRTG
ncbi:uncharacterized protein LOC115408470 [Salarias fasciatus]|uniref:uncharacterized protein LOC115408470 n=1 Tax=Salarias fasciatus TaxID=181472 RepID=UPI001176F258|nr:uncharacterized protein LOC115408470 [Salarias fasciatus]